MNIHTLPFSVSTSGKGTYEITAQVGKMLTQSTLQEGLVNVFCRHTSCSLILMENADPTARHDLHKYFDKIAPESDRDYKHNSEGLDDMPAHLKTVLTNSSLSIPFTRGQLLLGTWQGIFLFEHRVHPHNRNIVVSVMGK